MSGTLMSNPMLWAGLGMLGQSGPRLSAMAGGPGRGNLAQGAMQGLQSGQQMLYMQQMMEAQKAQREREEKQRALMEQALAGAPPLAQAFPEVYAKSMLAPSKPSGFMQDVEWLASLPEGDPRRELGMAFKTSPRVSVAIGTEKEKDTALSMALLAQAESDIAQYEAISPTEAKVAGTPMLGPLVSRKEAVALASAQDRWTNQMVKLVSGAAATDTERANIKNSYFAPAFAPPELKAEYARARREAMEAGAVRAGPAWQNFESVLKGKGGGPMLNFAGYDEVSFEAIYEAMPSGAEFIGPDGQPRRKP